MTLVHVFVAIVLVVYGACEAALMVPATCKLVEVVGYIENLCG